MANKAAGAFEKLPILDVALLRGSAKDKAQFLHELRETCLNVGFFYVKNHGIPEEVVESIFGAGKRFFELPADVKQKSSVAAAPHFVGWIPAESEITHGRADVRESFDYQWKGNTAPPIGAPIWKNTLGPTPFPSEADCPGFDKASTDWMLAAADLGYTLLHAIAESLGLESNALDQYVNDPEGRRAWLTKINRYPPVAPDANNTQGCGHHTDDGFLTILAIDDIPGLQVQNMAGTWIDVHRVPGTFVVNLGDYLEKLTGGAYVSTTHRVFSNVGGAVDRYSVPFFLDPHPLVIRNVEPIPDSALLPEIVAARNKDYKSDVMKGDQRKIGRTHGESNFINRLKSYPLCGDRWYPDLNWKQLAVEWSEGFTPGETDVW
ncbi:hypothetical protein CXG81DRAFT_8393 [Caulochytrium protostelioides]|uniref:Clavaminate synthase-like protein n=1 Tax=Caulochytrium protostelioides TaxID=1555241 RepID=A0A4P9WVX2_9FUNG|nr:Clavaminate synthase-like protein [Caulochytrium protostelioides]RKP04282.1 hypothetical protein CXG81DRAFT_8393 [Caulochytrium protostelioides]|eukprot:RKP04282.1 hypothetical protein CXG81DRAFT_8393 [Caulochytrium protostelioides]